MNSIEQEERKMPRYIVKAPTNGGTYAQQFGYMVIDTATDAEDYCSWAVMSGDKGAARRYARSLNVR